MVDIKGCPVPEQHAGHNWTGFIQHGLTMLPMVTYHRCPGVVAQPPTSGKISQERPISHHTHPVVDGQTQLQQGCAACEVLAYEMYMNPPAQVAAKLDELAKEFNRGISVLLHEMAASDDVANSQSGTLYRFVHKWAREYDVELRS